MSGGAKADVCPNCGAVLELDIDSRCRWCHAHIEVRQPSPRRARFESVVDGGLVPDSADDCASSAPFLYLLLSTLGPGLSFEPAVQDYLRMEPVLRQTIRALATAVSEAGVRVRDDGSLKNDFDENLRVYTPDEIWTFDLAIDVAAWLCALDGLQRKTQAQVAGNVRLLDREVTSHYWKKELKVAGDGPRKFHELRAKVPRHKPNPS
jgi:hypothetical protein